MTKHLEHRTGMIKLNDDNQVTGGCGMNTVHSSIFYNGQPIEQIYLLGYPCIGERLDNTQGTYEQVQQRVTSLDSLTERIQANNCGIISVLEKKKQLSNKNGSSIGVQADMNLNQFTSISMIHEYRQVIQLGVIPNFLKGYKGIEVEKYFLENFGIPVVYESELTYANTGGTHTTRYTKGKAVYN